VNPHLQDSTGKRTASGWFNVLTEFKDGPQVKDSNYEDMNEEEIERAIFGPFFEDKIEVKGEETKKLSKKAKFLRKFKREFIFSEPSVDSGTVFHSTTMNASLVFSNLEDQ